MMRFRRLSLRLRIAALTLLFFASASSSFTTKELRIEKFDAEIIVSPNGSIEVTEKIQAQFLGGPWHGLYRSIPVEYVTPQGVNYALFLNVKSITDAYGNRLKFETSRERQYRKLKIYIPDADNSTQTIAIEYTVRDALRFFEDHDELYWNVTGDEWDVPIQSATARIILPENTTNIRANVFTGAYQSTAHDADIEIAANGVEFRTRAPLRYHEGLTVAVAFDKGFVREPTFLDKTGLFLRSNWPLGLPIAAFVIMFYLWWTRGRDPRLRPIAAQYGPPDQLTPGEAGTLVDNSADMRDITSTIVDLAVRGYLVIEEHEHDRMLGLVHDKDYTFLLKKDRSEWSKLKPHEQELLNGFFSDGRSTVKLSDLHNQFYRYLSSIKERIFDSLISAGYYRRSPDSVRSAYLLSGTVIGVLMVFGSHSVAESLGMVSITFVFAGILTGLIICAFGWFMPAHTIKGVRAVEDVLGFEDFLNHVEAERFNRMIKTPEMFEKFLPYAMALGVEKNWSKAFQGIMTEPPQWYRGGAFGPQFYPYAFTNNLGVLSAHAGTVFASAPRSSGGSGFGFGGGGGGFSGGGFGGGGGGGF